MHGSGRGFLPPAEQDPICRFCARVPSKSPRRFGGGEENEVVFDLCHAVGLQESEGFLARLTTLG